MVVLSPAAAARDSGYPKAFVNILIYDKDYNLLDFTYDQINGGERVGVSLARHDTCQLVHRERSGVRLRLYLGTKNLTL